MALGTGLALVARFVGPVFSFFALRAVLALVTHAVVNPAKILSFLRTPVLLGNPELSAPSSKYARALSQNPKL